MFVFTAKLNRKKAVLAVVILAAVLAAVILLVSLSGNRPRPVKAEPSAPLSVTGPQEAAAYLRSLGWEVDPEPLEVKSLVIPRSFTGVYADYAALQARQGFPIAEYGGMEATRYSFRVLNYPDSKDEIVADLVVCGQTVIAGDIQSTALDGFMKGLKGED